MSYIRNMASLYNLPVGSDKCEYLFEAAKRRKECKDSVLQHKADENCTFRPNIGLSQRRVRSKSPVKQDIACSNDYLLSAEQEERKLESEPEQAQKLQNAIKLHETTPMGKYKVELYKKTFQLLDSDSDNAISSKKIDVSSNVIAQLIELNVELLKLYKPIFSEMEQLDQVLTLEDFVAVSESLYSKFSKTDRELFLESSGRECTFKVSLKWSECSQR
eukprot:TRINITY_DN11695_c0_g1_i8.p1 TRINITY_DN11695_c0_g1~~TRINITY_DN11695_c0_g1_i8.p1  ORF type:complete len:218 (+),score=39.13 TRINITY_DN11695_c0_g1_i8:693-1346(+)